MRRTVMAEGGPAPAGPYSHAVVSGGFVFVSGQGPIDPATVYPRALIRSMLDQGRNS